MNGILFFNIILAVGDRRTRPLRPPFTFIFYSGEQRPTEVLLGQWDNQCLIFI